jgi:putative peptide zinc metalloprotease protein
MSAPTPSSSQRIPWRQRADLRVVSLEFSGRRSWGVKDPVTLAYFELRDEEYFVLQQLNGRSTVDEICTKFHQRFRPRTLSSNEVQQFVGQLISQGLLVADGPGYGRILVARGQQSQSRRRWSRLGNLLSIRFRGFDPDRLLDWMMPRIGWLFSPVAVGAGLLLIAAAVILVVVQFDRVIERLPDTRALLSPPNLIWLPILLAVVKILHEFGHALTCKRFGGECRELGAMLLVFTPTLYCNVSDMWMVRDKWKRIAVSAAGMWVEAVIAASCTLLWWFSAPGLFHSLCLNLMFLCGVSTIVFNGNPLLRYDGYFVLADWLEIPNLQQQSVGTIRGWLGWWFCGLRDGDDGRGARPRKWLLFFYGVASAVYRIGLTFLILWSLHYWLKPYGLAVLVQVMAVPMIGLMILSPLAAAARFFRSTANRSRIDWSRFRFRTVLACVMLGLLLTIPLPSRVGAGALLDQDTAQRVYATLGGTLQDGVRIGESVEAGQEVARLTDPRLEAELIRLDGECDQHRLRLQQLERRRVRDPEVAALIPAVREALRDFEAQLAQLRKTADRLVLRAPCSGIVLPPTWHSGVAPQGSLRSWTGSPLQEQNRGCFVKPGTTVCLVGPEESRVAILLVNQDDINLVRVGQEARIVWRELSGEVLTGRIVEIAALDLDLLPRDAVQRLNLPARPTAEGTLVPIGTWYQARVHLDPTDAPLLRGAAGDARILIDPQSLGTRIVRWLTRTFG